MTAFRITWLWQRIAKDRRLMIVLAFVFISFSGFFFGLALHPLVNLAQANAPSGSAYRDTPDDAPPPSDPREAWKQVRTGRLVAWVVGWGVALFEYLLQVPANRIGFTALSLPQLKILQEVVTLAVFVPFSLLFMKQPVKLDFLWAGLCMMGAVYFIFRD